VDAGLLVTQARVEPWNIIQKDIQLPHLHQQQNGNITVQHVTVHEKMAGITQQASCINSMAQQSSSVHTIFNKIHFGVETNARRSRQRQMLQCQSQNFGLETSLASRP